jgi:hypothetical protein
MESEDNTDDEEADLYERFQGAGTGEGVFITHTARYTELAPQRFAGFWRE